jgi:carboxymethylenebutenolidase
MSVPPAVDLPGGVPAHLAVPPVGDGPWPGVVVLHEAYGLNDDIRQHADRLAAAGYLALAPDLFGGRPFWRCIRAVVRDAARGAGPSFDAVEAARAWLAARDDCTGRVGVIGFCLGGGFALLSARRGFAAAAPNYAHLPDDLDATLRGACPVVASYGARDKTLRGTAAELEAALGRAGVEHDVVEYPDAGHSFLNRPDVGPLGPVLRVAGIGFHEPSAQDAWGRILRFFDAHLRAG